MHKGVEMVCYNVRTANNSAFSKPREGETREVDQLLVNFSVDFSEPSSVGYHITF